jgi:hypothetical protein
MKKFSFLVVCMMLTLSAFGQHRNDDCVRPILPIKLKVGDCYYSQDYKGIKMFMAETKDYNPELYNELLPVYSELSKKVKISKNVLITSTVFGSIAMIAGVSSIAGNSFHVDESVEKNMQEGFVIGSGIIAIGAIISYCLYPDDDDIYHFVNIHNRVTKSDKINFYFGFNENGAGIGALKRF